ncbi:MAG: UbiA prenyltransferase family protein [Candidatus Diapherotrites archaeon]|nr:UbiA prenyltransferase family protein [Candidatus Diapherotrites archaeon]
MNSFKGLFLGLLDLMRLPEWSKSLGNMLIAAVMAAFFGNLIPDFGLVVYGFLAVGFLWSGLYTLNDWTDHSHDALHPVKKSRAIPSGKVPANVALVFSIFLIALSFAIGFTINFFFLLCLLAMLLNQFLYTLKPFNFKKRPVLDLISGSLINPIFRFYAGWVLFIPAFNAPLLVLIFILGFQFGGYTIYRIASRSHDEKLDYKSSVVVFGEKKVRTMAYFGMLLGALAFFGMLLTNFFSSFQFLGILPLRYFWLAVLSLAMLPLYWHALKNPQEMDLKKMYNLVYVHYSLFILGFVLLYFFNF